MFFKKEISSEKESMQLPLRKVAVHLEIDISRLSKVERRDRPASPDYLQPLAEILKLDLKKFKQNIL